VYKAANLLLVVNLIARYHQTNLEHRIR